MISADSERPSVSVVVNTFNRAGLVGNGIQAVLDQTHRDLELIVVDDGSTDDTLQVVSSFHDVRLRVHAQNNTGLSAARNAGAKLATGEWIAFLDDDDTVEPSWLAELVGATTLGVGLVFAGHQRVLTSTGEVSSVPAGPLGGIYRNVVGSILAGTWMMRRELFELTGGFLEDLPTLVQSEFMLRAVPACLDSGFTTAVTESTGFRYTVSPPSQRPTLTSRLSVEAGEKIMERHRALFHADPSSCSSWHATVGVSAARLGEFSRARGHFSAAARARPFEWRNWARLATSTVPMLAAKAWPPLD